MKRPNQFFGAPNANYIMRMSVNERLRLQTNEQAHTKSKDQIELKLFSCAQMLKKKKKQHVAAF